MKLHQHRTIQGMFLKKGGLLLWCLLLLLIVAFSFKSGGMRLSTDLFDLLPETEVDQTTAQAADEFFHSVSNRFFLLVASSSEEMLHVATDKLASQLQQSQLFDPLVANIEPDWLERVGAFYYPYRFQLLAPKDQRVTHSDLGMTLSLRSQQLLLSPSSLVTASQLLSDPLFLLQRYLQSFPKGALNIKPVSGYLQVHQNGHYYNLIAGKLKGSVLSLVHQQEALAKIDEAINSVTKQDDLSKPVVDVIRSGVIFHAAAGSDIARREVSTVGVGSIVCILLLIITVFRSVMPIFLCLLSIGVGISAGFVFTEAIFGTVHIFTLVFGASLIGVSIDYSFHFFAEWQRQKSRWSPIAALKHILPGMSLGLLTSLLGYLPMLATPFPGLKQMALFSTFGLFAAWLTVVAVYPLMVRSPSRYRDQDIWLMAWVDCWLGLLRKRYSKSVIIYWSIAFSLCSAGVLMLSPQDDIRQLQHRSPELVHADQTVRDTIGDFTENRFFLVKGETIEQVLQRDEQLARVLDQKVEKGELKSFQAITEFLPSLRQQSENYDKLHLVYDNTLADFMRDTGFTIDAFRQSYKSFLESSGRQLSLDKWLAGPIKYTHGYLWLGNIGGEYFTAVLLSGVSPEWDLTVLEHSIKGVEFIDKTSDTSALFSRYRVLMSWLLLAAYLMIGVLLMLRYGVAGAFRVMLPPLLSAVLTLSLLGVTQQPINLFHILALLMILGIGIDYTLFFQESSGDQRYTFLAITLSAMTTVLSFGLLSLSSTAAISGFGLTVLIGIGFSYLLAPFAIDKRSL